DRATPPAKYVEHARRYAAAARRSAKRARHEPALLPTSTPPPPPAGEDAVGAGENAAAAAAGGGGGGGVDVDIASDAEALRALEEPRLPRRWKHFRGNRLFTRELVRLVVECLERSAAAWLLERRAAAHDAGMPHARGARLIVVGDPRFGEDSHVPRVLCLVGAPRLAAGAPPPPPPRTGSPPRRRVAWKALADAHWRLDYWEGDFSVVH